MPKSRGHRLAFLPLWVGDYLRDTSHLSTEEHGAYLLLLMAAWTRGGALPDDPLRLATITRVSPKRWARVWASLGEFFEVDAERGEIRQRRLTRELSRAAEIHESTSARARHAAQVRHSRRASSNAPSTEGAAQAASGDPPSEAEKCLPITQERKPEIDSASSGAKRPKAQRSRESGVASSTHQAVLDDCYPQPQPHPHRQQENILLAESMENLAALAAQVKTEVRREAKREETKSERRESPVQDQRPAIEQSPVRVMLAIADLIYAEGLKAKVRPALDSATAELVRVREARELQAISTAYGVGLDEIRATVEWSWRETCWWFGKASTAEELRRLWPKIHAAYQTDRKGSDTKNPNTDPRRGSLMGGTDEQWKRRKPKALRGDESDDQNERGHEDAE